MKNYPVISDYNLEQKTVLVRADLDVPRTEMGTLAHDFRLIELLPTLYHLQKSKCTIILIGHAGNPTLPLSKQEKLFFSHALLIDWFTQKGFVTFLSRTIEEAQQCANDNNQALIILENLRFFPQEKKSDPLFSKQLASLGTFFVQEAFATLHRFDASITLLPRFFNNNNRAFGFYTHKTLHFLCSVQKNKRTPVTILIGGAKIATKLVLIEKLLTYATTIVIVPPLCFTFMKAQGIETGTSLVDNTLIPQAKKILAQSSLTPCKLMLPSDFLTTKTTFDKPTLPLDHTHTIARDACGISIGPKTFSTYNALLKESRTIIINGPLGKKTIPETAFQMQSLVESLSACTADYIIVAGGDTIEAVFSCKPLPHNVTPITGGGATLTFLAHEQLPGLEAFDT